MAMTADSPTVIGRFRRAMKTSGMREATITAYGRDAEMWMEFLDSQGPASAEAPDGPDGLAEDERRMLAAGIEEMRAFLELRFKDRKVPTRNRSLVAVRKLYCLLGAGKDPTSGFSLLPGGETPPVILDADSVTRLINVCDGKPAADVGALRDSIIINLAVTFCASLSHLLLMRVQNVSFGSAEE